MTAVSREAAVFFALPVVGYGRIAIKNEKRIGETERGQAEQKSAAEMTAEDLREIR